MYGSFSPVLPADGWDDRNDMSPPSVHSGASECDILQIPAVNVVAALTGFEVNVVHLAVGSYGLPPYVSLVVAHVKTVYVITRVLALYIVLRVSTDY